MFFSVSSLFVTVIDVFAVDFFDLLDDKSANEAFLGELAAKCLLLDKAL